jgi:hypothetical protein
MLFFIDDSNVSTSIRGAFKSSSDRAFNEDFADFSLSLIKKSALSSNSWLRASMSLAILLSNAVMYSVLCKIEISSCLYEQYLALI